LRKTKGQAAKNKGMVRQETKKTGSFWQLKGVIACTYLMFHVPEIARLIAGFRVWSSLEEAEFPEGT
jgi:hypothetical protein